VGGADVTSIGLGGDSVGKRNILAARSLLWKNGVMVQREAVGGTDARTVSLHVSDGQVHVSSGRETLQVL
jgi:chemotaxis protein CheD